MRGTAAKLTAGRLVAQIVDGDLRRICFDGVEVLRRVSYPVRDADWGTESVTTLSEDVGPDRYEHRFAARSGLFQGTFQCVLDGEGQMRLAVSLTFNRAAAINRAGFTLLHPIAGVAGQPLVIVHPDGRETQTRFPDQIAPAQPARAIRRLRHPVGHVEVTLDFEGEIFEMEDQRNWSDASFKTYCRPLSLPRPFQVSAGKVLTQTITLRLKPAPSHAPATSKARSSGQARMPQVTLAHQPGLSSATALPQFPSLPVVLRMDASTPENDLAALADRDDVAVEVVFSDLTDLRDQVRRLGRVGLRPSRIVGLPLGYLLSHQPEGPWPAGPTPADAVHALRDLFPDVPVGSGSLTNFTEFNRCPPHPSALFATFGNTAIVHAADDLSVRETLEAIPAILTSAKTLAPGKPLHLGLFSIGMRSNPYGRDVVPNPTGSRVPMAMDDPRQSTPFAAAYAVGVLLSASRAGVDSLALAMPDGPLGAAGRPLAGIVRAASRLAGELVAWTEEPPLTVLRGPGVTLVANIGPDDCPFADAPGSVLPPDSALVLETAA